MAESLLLRRRGLILLDLHGQYPLSLAATMLELRVEPFYVGDAQAYSRDIAYLEDLKLVERGEAEALGRKIPTLQLTPRGVDVVTGVVAEPGIHIDRGPRR